MKCVVNLNEDTKIKFDEKNHGKKYVTQSAEVSKLWDAKQLGFHIEILEAGAFSCPYHFHHLEEELFLVLEGKAMVRQDDEFFEVTKGDLILFKAMVAHQFYNHTDSQFKFLALSNYDANETCEYPDSNKKWERQTKRLSQHDLMTEDYWKGEESPELKWPSWIVSTK